MKDNCLTVLPWFLPNINMNQPWFTHVPFLNIPISPLYSVNEPWLEFLESDSKFPLDIYFTYDNVCFHVALSIPLNLSFSTQAVFISLFSMTVSPLMLCK